MGRGSGRREREREREKVRVKVFVLFSFFFSCKKKNLPPLTCNRRARHLRLDPLQDRDQHLLRERRESPDQEADRRDDQDDPEDPAECFLFLRSRVQKVSPERLELSDRLLRLCCSSSSLVAAVVGLVAAERGRECVLVER